MRSNRSEDLFLFRDQHDFGKIKENTRFFFRDHHDFGKNKGNTRSKPPFFKEHQFLGILASGP